MKRISLAECSLPQEVADYIYESITSDPPVGEYVPIIFMTPEFIQQNKHGATIIAILEPILLSSWNTIDGAKERCTTILTLRDRECYLPADVEGYFRLGITLESRTLQHDRYGTVNYKLLKPPQDNRTG